MYLYTRGGWKNNNVPRAKCAAQKQQNNEYETEKKLQAFFSFPSQKNDSQHISNKNSAEKVLARCFDTKKNSRKLIKIDSSQKKSPNFYSLL